MKHSLEAIQNIRHSERVDGASWKKWQKNIGDNGFSQKIDVTHSTFSMPIFSWTQFLLLFNSWGSDNIYYSEQQ